MELTKFLKPRTVNHAKKIFTYSKNGTLLDLDWFDHCRSVKELNASAVSLDYETLINTPYNYSDIPVKLSGTVVELYEIPTHGYIKITRY